jgi:hypothetical protein
MEEAGEVPVPVETPQDTNHNGPFGDHDDFSDGWGSGPDVQAIRLLIHAAANLDGIHSFSTLTNSPALTVLSKPYPIHA